jgi:hypothetical protein
MKGILLALVRPKSSLAASHATDPAVIQRARMSLSQAPVPAAAPAKSFSTSGSNHIVSLLHGTSMAACAPSRPSLSHLFPVSAELASSCFRYSLLSLPHLFYHFEPSHQMYAITASLRMVMKTTAHTPATCLSFIHTSRGYHDPPCFHCTAPLLDHGQGAPGMVLARLLTGHGMMAITAPLG